MTQTLLTTLIVIVISYALGCFSTAYYLVRWRTGQDIRQTGSGTAGARNAGRLLGKSGFVLTMLGDALKGVLAVGLARWLELPSVGVVAAMLAVVAGHLWPVQLGGKGGKGAATALGCVTTINPWLGLAILAVAAVLTPILRTSNRGGMVAMALAPVIAWLLGLDWVLVLGVFVLIVMLLFAHRSNWSKRSSDAPEGESGAAEAPAQ